MLRAVRARIPSSRIRAAFLIASFVVLVLPGSAVAHADLVRAIPADGETVTQPVTVISGRYSEDMAGNSRLQVLDHDGGVVATGGVDPADDRRMVARPASPLGDGTYTVKSTTVSAEDGDIDRKEWTFTVAVAAAASPTDSPSDGPGLSPSASASVGPSSTPSASASTTPIASPAPTTPASGSNDVLLPIIAALAIVAVGAGFLLKRERSPRA
jgi:methionine-rich copper-binding protein CopC